MQCIKIRLRDFSSNLYKIHLPLLAIAKRITQNLAQKRATDAERGKMLDWCQTQENHVYQARENYVYQPRENYIYQARENKELLPL